ncbi:MAG: hypothetical protein HY791_06075 [Deltaproteobacteria bacterium]|nr:hypothetical protein [Deltaproteobacteria bacterium]
MSGDVGLSVPRTLTRALRVLATVLGLTWAAGLLAATIGLAVLIERTSHHFGVLSVWQNGAPVSVVVEQRESTTRFRAHRFFVSYRVEGESELRRARITFGDWRTIELGSHLQARRLGQTVTMESETLVARRFKAGLPMLLFGVLALFMLTALMTIRAARQRYLLLHGEPIDGAVTSSFGSDRALVRFSRDGREHRTTVRVPVARHPILERPARDLLLLVDPRQPSRCLAARRSWFVEPPVPDTKVAEVLRSFLSEWRGLCGPEHDDLAAGLISTGYALDTQGVAAGVATVDRVFGESALAPRILRKWMAERAAQRRGFDATERSVLYRIRFFELGRADAVKRMAGAATVSLSIGFGLAARLLLTLPIPTALVCTALLVVLAYPVLALLSRALWS